MPEFFDIACNLTHESILPSIDDVISEAKLVNVNKFGLISAELEDFSKIASLVKRYPDDLAPTYGCLLYTSPSPRDQRGSRMPSSA